MQNAPVTQNIFNPTTGAKGFQVPNQPLPDGWRNIDKTLGPSASPTIVTDANIRESTIPNTIADTTSATSQNQPSPTTTNGQQPNNQGTQNGADTGSQNETVDYSKMSYEDIYNHVLGKTSDQTQDPTMTAEMALIDRMSKNSDALTRNQLDSIKAGYEDSKQLLQEEQQGTNGALRHLLGTSGANRTGSGVGILDAKAKNDIRALNGLQNQEKAAELGVYKAKQEQDFQTLGKQLDLLKEARANKLALAQKISESIVSKNNTDREYTLKVDEFNHNVSKDEKTLANEQRKIEQGEYEFRDLKDAFGNTIGTQVYDKASGKPISALKNGNSPGTLSDPSNVTLNGVDANADGTPNQEQQQAFMQTLPPPIRASIQALIDYRSLPTSYGYKNRGQLIEWAHMADPTYDDTQAAPRQALMKSYTSGKDHKNVVSLNTAINHAGEVAKDFVGMNNADITKYNSVKNWWNQNVGKGDVTKVINDLNAMGGELATTYKGTAGTDAEITNISKGISTNSSPAQVKAFIESSMNLLGGRVNALEESYTNAFGKPFGRSLINPSTIKVLSDFKNRGYGIDVKGVNYTDKDAYVKYAPDAATKLSQAYAKLKDSGLATPENVLQLAQEL